MQKIFLGVFQKALYSKDQLFLIRVYKACLHKPEQFPISYCPQPNRFESSLGGDLCQHDRALLSGPYRLLKGWLKDLHFLT